MSRLFEDSLINSMRLKNRFVRSATWEGMADENGACTSELVKLMVRLAEGEVGLIITSHAYVREDGQAGVRQLGIYDDDLIRGLAKMTRAVHDSGGSIVLQLAHAGFLAHPKLTGRTPLAFSQVQGIARSPRKEMTREDMAGLVKAFRQAGLRAREAGFDGVQIHAAHGYLLSQALSPFFNRRTDAYGGCVENRARLLLEVVQALREDLRSDYPILVKMNSQDFLEGGLDLEDSLKVGRMLQERGIDAIELSGGTFISGELNPSRQKINSEEREAYFREAGKQFKESIDIPLILVGGNRSLSVAERLVAEGYADYISMSRPFIREPGLVVRWKAGDLRKAACISDNQCFGPAGAGEGIYCVVEKKKKESQCLC